MKIKINQPQLNASLSFLQKVIPTKPQLPILSSIKIVATAEDGVIISATDLIIGMQTQLEAGVEEPGTIILPGRELKSLVSSLSQEFISITSIQNKVTISTTHTTITMQTQAHEEFPIFPEITGERISISTDQLERIVTRCAFAASSDQTRPILTSVLWKYTPGKLEIVATDGFRLSWMEYEQDHPLGECSLLIPAKAIIESYHIAKQLGVTDVEIIISEPTKQVLFQIGQVKKFVRLIDGVFPPYEKIIPSTFATTMSIDREELQEILKRALIFGKDSSYIVTFRIAQDSFTVEATSPTLGAFTDEATTIKVEGEPNTIAFNGKYVAEYVAACSSDAMYIQLNDSLKPAQFCEALTGGERYIVMPFKVS